VPKSRMVLASAAKAAVIANVPNSAGDSGREMTSVERSGATGRRGFPAPTGRASDWRRSSGRPPRDDSDALPTAGSHRRPALLPAPALRQSGLDLFAVTIDLPAQFPSVHDSSSPCMPIWMGTTGSFGPKRPTAAMLHAANKAANSARA
jgi:hypothetical protein